MAWQIAKHGRCQPSRVARGPRGPWFSMLGLQFWLYSYTMLYLVNFCHLGPLINPQAPTRNMGCMKCGDALTCANWFAPKSESRRNKRTPDSPFLHLFPSCNCPKRCYHLRKDWVIKHSRTEQGAHAPAWSSNFQAQRALVPLRFPCDVSFTSCKVTQGMFTLTYASHQLDSSDSGASSPVSW